MKKFIIKGPTKKIIGSVNISGAKNSCLPLMAASILFKGKVTLKKCTLCKRCTYNEKAFNCFRFKSRNI